MPELKTYDIFISHAWKYGDEYDCLVNLLDQYPLFSYRNYSAPADKPLQNLDGTDVIAKQMIMRAINRKIAPVNAVLVVSGMYCVYRDWMEFEINCAREKGKPIIAVRPWGAERVPQYVQAVADTVVGWNATSIVAAIREYSL